MISKNLCVLMLWTKVVSGLVGLTLPMLLPMLVRLLSKHKDVKVFEDHPNPVMLVLTG